jgi:hypothetical protein
VRLWGVPECRTVRYSSWEEVGDGRLGNEGTIGDFTRIRELVCREEVLADDL